MSSSHRAPGNKPWPEKSESPNTNLREFQSELQEQEGNYEAKARQEQNANPACLRQITGCQAIRLIELKLLLSHEHPTQETENKASEDKPHDG